MNPFLKTPDILSRHIRDERGSITAFSLYILVASLMLGGLAIDLSSVMTARTRLQVTADAAAHAALLARDSLPETEAKTEALRIAALNMPVAHFKAVLTENDITFGTWDTENRLFAPSPGARGAVRVVSRRAAEAGNPVTTFLLKLVGITEVDLTVSATFATYRPTCFREGFVASGIVDLQSNNSYSNGFCIHSNDHVSLNSNNYFEPGTVVSMPNEEDIDLPNSGFKTNTGLADALRSGSYHIRVLKQIDDMIAGLKAHDDRYVPDYITTMTTAGILNISGKTAIDQTNLTVGRIHQVSCGGSGLTISGGAVLRRVVIVTDCAVKFGQNVVLEEVVVATTNTGSKSIASASGLQVGKNDHCAVDGGSQLITMGSMDFPADLRIFGGQLLAKGDINFAANANGIEGASMVAGGEISGTSNMAMGFCGTGMENNFHAEYFRLTE